MSSCCPRQVLFALSFVLFYSQYTGASDPEEHMDAIELIRYHGYPAQSHEVQTRDGYILGVQRIPPPSDNQSHPVVFLQHGLFCSSTNWLTNLKTQSFAYLLADKGFDVWLGNVRGNTYSLKHVSLTTKDDKFWEFSMDEHALIDLPDMIDYVLSYTSAEKLYYIGHSQGTFMGFAGFTSNLTLASRIAKFYPLAPVITVGHVKGLFRVLADFMNDFQDIRHLFDLFGHGEFLPSSGLLNKLGASFCNTDLKGVCGDLLFLISGFDPKNLNESRTPVYISHTPAGTSVQNIVHWAQLVKTGKFCMYNPPDGLHRTKFGQMSLFPVDSVQYIEVLGLDRYTPPCYDISRLNVPTYMFTGGKDWLADPVDVSGLTKALDAAKIPYTNKLLPNYAHLDFIWAIHANQDVYDVIINDILASEKRH